MYTKHKKRQFKKKFTSKFNESLDTFHIHVLREWDHPLK